MNSLDEEQDLAPERLSMLRIRKLRINDAAKDGFRLSSPNFSSTDDGIRHELEDIRDRRIAKTGPSAKLTWIHIPNNDRTLCEVRTIHI